LDAIVQSVAVTEDSSLALTAPPMYAEFEAIVQSVAVTMDACAA
jgi:hypothetical protein